VTEESRGRSGAGDPLEAFVAGAQPPLHPAVPAPLGLPVPGGAEGAAAGGALGREAVADLRPLLQERALGALTEALARPGRDREGAFRLLAADALLTWAAEAAVEEGDPEAALAAMVQAVAEGVR